MLAVKKFGQHRCSRIKEIENKHKCMGSVNCKVASKF